MMKPFSTEETRRILRHLQQPAVFMNMACDWPALQWTAEHLSVCLGDRQVRFRLGKKEELNTPLFETQCLYVEAELQHFLCWTKGQCGEEVGPFSEFPYSEYWAYADYKYIAMLFQDQPSMFEDVKWCHFGFEGRGGRESTLWVGTEGANTPCHLDSYGCNLVLQVQGRKRWHLFPPDDTAKLYPTRIPYEESSVFSQVDVLRPDLRRFPDFCRARAHVVTLEPGQVLYVPRHWWHYVESVDPVTVSINSWIELEADDDVARVSEAVTKAVVCAVKSVQSDDNDDEWLNPTEEAVASHDENMHYLNLAIRACVQRQNKLCRDKVTQAPRDARPVKRDSGGQMKENSHSRSLPSHTPFGVPFGPHLVPVRCQPDDSTEAAEVKPSWNREGGKPPEDGGAVGPRTEPAAADISRQLSAGLTRSDGTSGAASQDQEDSIITTNDLLDCLVHPDVITRVTKLLLERRGAERQGTAAPCPL